MLGILKPIVPDQIPLELAVNIPVPVTGWLPEAELSNWPVTVIELLLLGKPVIPWNLSFKLSRTLPGTGVPAPVGAGPLVGITPPPLISKFWADMVQLPSKLVSELIE